MKCYNQNFAMHWAIYSTSYSIDKVLLTNKKDSRMWKKYPDPFRKLQSSRVSLTFQQNHVIMVRRIWNVRDAYPTFSILSLSVLFCFSPFHPSFLPRLTFSIKIAIGIFLLFIQKNCLPWQKNGRRRARSPRQY